MNRDEYHIKNLIRKLQILQAEPLDSTNWRHALEIWLQLINLDKRLRTGVPSSKGKKKETCKVAVAALAQVLRPRDDPQLLDRLIKFYHNRPNFSPADNVNPNFETTKKVAQLFTKFETAFPDGMPTQFAGSANSILSVVINSEDYLTVMGSLESEATNIQTIRARQDKAVTAMQNGFLALLIAIFNYVSRLIYAAYNDVYA